MVVLAWPDNASPPRYAGECHCVSPQLSCLLPEAPCTNAIRTAQSIVADVAALGDGVGDGQAMDLLSENGIGALASCRLHHSEHDLHKVIRDFDLELPIPLYKVPGQDFEALHIRDWISLILRKDLWHTLSGLDKPDPERCRRIWRDFWCKYRQQNGGHPIFEMEAKGLIKLENSAACLFHGNEGRGKKRRNHTCDEYVLHHGQRHPGIAAMSRRALPVATPELWRSHILESHVSWLPPQVHVQEG